MPHKNFRYGNTSLQRLATAHPVLQTIFMNVIKNSHLDITIIQGHRTEAEHKQYLKNGKTKVPYEKSKHSKQPSLAIDASPYPIPGGKTWGKFWKDRVKFYELAALVRYEANKLGVKIRWGGDWDGDTDYSDQTFDDLVHFELILEV